MRFARRTLAATLSMFVSLAVLTVGATQAAATTDFYDPPSPLPPGENGDVIRHEPSDFYLLLELVDAPGSAHRIMYRSTDTHGDPIAVTGTVLVPDKPWNGPGVRPIVGYAPGTRGIGDSCAPSKSMASGTDYEGPFLAGLLAAGYGVVVTDYQGLGTPGMHTYVNRKAEAHALLDAVRAAQRLDVAGLPDNGPVATAGYSQGGGASAAAAELAASYASELDFVGAYAGAPPANLEKVANFLDGGYGVGLVGYALRSLNYAYDLNIPSLLNEEGKQFWHEIADQCIVETIPAYAFTRSETLTKSGKSLAYYMNQQPYASAIAKQRIGEREPQAPVLVLHSRLDDLVPYGQSRTMAESWCEMGATVQFTTLLAPTHVGGAIAAYPRALAWLADRFANEQAPSNCDTL